MQRKLLKDGDVKRHFADCTLFKNLPFFSSMRRRCYAGTEDGLLEFVGGFVVRVGVRFVEDGHVAKTKILNLPFYTEYEKDTPNFKTQNFKASFYIEKRL